MVIIDSAVVPLVLEVLMALEDDADGVEALAAGVGVRSGRRMLGRGLQR